jgi:hypothetical protein
MSDIANSDKSETVNVELPEDDNQDDEKDFMQIITEELDKMPETENLDKEDNNNELETAEKESKDEKTVEEGETDQGTVEESEKGDSGVPQWIGEFDIQEDDGSEFFIQKDGDKELKIPSNLVNDVVNWREKRGKADWMRKPVHKMTEDERTAYQWGQRSHQRFLAGQNESQEQIENTQKSILERAQLTPEEQIKFEALKEAWNDRLGLKKEPEAKKPEEKIPAKEIKKKYLENIETLNRKLLDGEIEQEEYTKSLPNIFSDFESDIKNDVIKEARDIAREEAQNIVSQNNENISEREWVMQCQKEAQEIMATGDARYERLAFYPSAEESILGKLLLDQKVHPVTKEKLTTKTAFELALQLENEQFSGRKYNLAAANAKPKKTSHRETEQTIDETQMEGMSYKELLAHEMKTQNVVLDD